MQNNKFGIFGSMLDPRSSEGISILRSEKQEKRGLDLLDLLYDEYLRSNIFPASKVGSPTLEKWIYESGLDYDEIKDRLVDRIRHKKCMNISLLREFTTAWGLPDLYLVASNKSPDKVLLRKEIDNSQIEFLSEEEADRAAASKFQSGTYKVIEASPIRRKSIEDINKENTPNLLKHKLQALKEKSKYRR
jgi:hypothetical protein